MTLTHHHRKLLLHAARNGGSVTDYWLLLYGTSKETKELRDAELIVRRHTCEGEALREAWERTGNALLEESREAIDGANWADAVEPLQRAEQIDQGLRDGAWHLTEKGWDEAEAMRLRATGLEI